MHWDPNLQALKLVPIIAHVSSPHDIPPDGQQILFQHHLPKSSDMMYSPKSNGETNWLYSESHICHQQGIAERKRTPVSIKSQSRSKRVHSKGFEDWTPESLAEVNDARVWLSNFIELWFSNTVTRFAPKKNSMSCWRVLERARTEVWILDFGTIQATSSFSVSTIRTMHRCCRRLRNMKSQRFRIWGRTDTFCRYRHLWRQTAKTKFCECFRPFVRVRRIFYFYKGRSQEKTQLQRPEFFLLRSPPDWGRRRYPINQELAYWYLS